MAFENLPTILALVAGFIVCIVTFIYDYGDVEWLLLVLGAIVVFYIVGLCLRQFFSVVLADIPEEESEETEEEETEEEAE